MKLQLKWSPLFSQIRFNELGKILHYFGQHIKPHRPKLFIASLYTVAVTVTSLLQPWPLKIIFDVILSGHKPSFLNRFPALSDTENLVAAVALSILALALLHGLFQYGQKFLIAGIGQRLVASVRRRLYNHIQSLSRSFHDRHHTGDLMARLTGDILRLRDLLSESFLFLFENIFLLLGMTAIMFFMDWQLSLVALSVLPLLVLASSHFSVKINKAVKKQRKKEGQMASFISETLSASNVVQAFSREDYEGGRFAEHEKSSLKQGLKALRHTENLSRTIQIFVAAGTSAVLWLGVQKVLRGVLTAGDLLVFTAYLRTMYRPVLRTATVVSHIAKATACSERIINILEIPPEIADAPDSIPAPRFQGGVVFENVTFSYDGGRDVLENISFQVKAGERVAVIGPSGAGKSTIGNLILRFYDPEKGRILIDGTNIRRFKVASLREQISVVLQAGLLFSATIRENIAYGKLDATAGEIENAARAANAHEFILQLDEGYDTAIAEKGVRLSGGQRQRIAIARAIIRNAPIIVLDEPMTALDRESESKVREALGSLIRGKTCFLITHDLEAIRDADLVLFFEDGRIVEQGRPRELAATSARYQKFSANTQQLKEREK